MIKTLITIFISVLFASCGINSKIPTTIVLNKGLVFDYSISNFHKNTLSVSTSIQNTSNDSIFILLTPCIGLKKSIHMDTTKFEIGLDFLLCTPPTFPVVIGIGPNEKYKEFIHIIQKSSEKEIRLGIDLFLVKSNFSPFSITSEELLSRPHLDKRIIWGPTKEVNKL